METLFLPNINSLPPQHTGPSACLVMFIGCVILAKAKLSDGSLHYGVGNKYFCSPVTLEVVVETFDENKCAGNIRRMRVTSLFPLML